MIKLIPIHSLLQYATSVIILLLRDGLYRKTMNNTLYEAYGRQISKTMADAIANANKISMTEKQQ